jgi:hypothetical protein
MKHLFAGCVRPAAILALTPVAIAQPEQAVRDWVSTEYARAQKLPSSPFFASLRTEMHPGVPDGMLREWQAEVSGKPFHPLRPLIDEELSRRTHGPTVTTYTLWRGGPDSWRINVDAPDFCLDSARGHGQAWQLTNSGTLTLHNPSQPRPELDNSLLSTKDSLAILLSQGISLLNVSNADSMSVSAGDRPGQWVVQAVSPRGTRWTLAVSAARADGGVFTVTSLTELRTSWLRPRGSAAGMLRRRVCS